MDMLDPDRILIFESETLVRISESLASSKVNKKVEINAAINCSSEQTGKCTYRQKLIMTTTGALWQMTTNELFDAEPFTVDPTFCRIRVGTVVNSTRYDTC